MGVGDSRRVQRPAWRPRVAAVAPVVVALLVAACSGGGSDAAADPDAPTSDSSEPADTPSTSAPAETKTSTPPGPAVPEDAPEIINTGDDFEAIYRSLNEFVNWLATNPDPELVDVIYSPRGPAYERQIESNRVNQDEGLRAGGRWQDIVEIEDRGQRDGPGGSPLYDLVVTLAFPTGQVVRADGSVYSDREAHTSRFLVTLLSDDGRWRIGDSVELL